MKLGSITIVLRTRESTECHHKGLPAPKKFKTNAYAGKGMLTVFWNSEGAVLTDYLEKGAGVNSEHYTETLKYLLQKRITRKRAEIKDTLLQQDNARPYVSPQLIPLSAYSLHLVFSDFHLFLKLNEDLWGRNFRSDEEVKAAVRPLILENEKDFFLWTEFKNLLNDGKGLLKLEEIMWKSDYSQL